MEFLNKVLELMRLTEDDEDYGDDYGYDEEDYEDEPPRKRGKFTKKHSDDEDFDDKKYDDRTNSKVTPIRVKKSNGSNMRVYMFKPTSVEDAREITETLQLDYTIILNVEGLDVDVSQRIIDFMSGASFAINGSLQKISNYIFLVTPPNVDTFGEYASVIDAFDMPSMRAEY